ncbi:MFS transporter [Paractinoplanes abujensis]|uniref:Putative MFS family arabinose efflux permease n=1 Tax=Paractinoplanes abujensis TaxID=882441 RepID=A0A7W7G3X7_9ACTN|nr:MFS transporter [Actinoplanes abujensis]MBB4693221.1 putative MFS family arabinose efflux permease [Actinoplanes abujensis]GID24420.1 MFS transporter [Actinoplanes abujensis]
MQTNHKPASWAAVVSVGVGTFALVTTEFLPIGLLPEIARDLGITEGTAGLMVTIPGVAAAVAAPAVVALAGGVDRRRVLYALLLLLVASNIVVASATHVVPLLIGRVLLGIAIGGFWSIGGSLGPRLREGPDGARASSIILSGVSLGTVAGLPAGALIGSLLGWRLVFVASAVLGLLVVAAIVAFVPPVAPQPGAGIRGVPMVLRSAAVRAGLIAGVFVFAGHFAAYTYITPFLNDALEADGATLSAVLLAFGGAGFLGNLAGGFAARYAVRPTAAAAPALLSAAVAVMLLVAGHAIGTVAAVIVWGFAFGAIPVATQTYLFTAAPDRLESVAAAFVSVSQASIGAGALLGGIMVDRSGEPSALGLGAGAALIGAAVLAGLGRSRTAAPAPVPGGPA